MKVGGQVRLKETVEEDYMKTWNLALEILTGRREEGDIGDKEEDRRNLGAAIEHG